MTRLTALAVAALWSASLLARAGTEVECWLTTEDLSCRFKPETPASFARGGALSGHVIEIDTTKRYQTILGLGASLEATTCSNLWRLTPEQRELAIERLVDPETGIGMNLMRVCMGTSDFTGDPWYSYDDLPPGETDPGLQRFSIDRDRAYLLPVIRLAKAKNPALLFFASPWSPPGWMKSNGSLIGGHLLPQHYPAYAEYFARFIEAYQSEGVPIHAVTVQNEPGVDRATEKDPKWHYPSCRWRAEQERDFIRDHLGPTLRRHRLKTKIWCYDHNYNVSATGDDPGLPYPRAILQDPRAARFTDGVAFHGYAGEARGMTLFHTEFPDHPLHFSEGSVFGIHGAVDLLERLRHWASSYNAWVVMLDTEGKPNNGPFPATHAILALDAASLEVRYLLEYHVYGHVTKFVQRGARRVECTPGNKDFNHVAFRNPDGSIVVVLVNTTASPREFTLRWQGQSLARTLGPKSLLTCRWTP